MRVTEKQLLIMLGVVQGIVEDKLVITPEAKKFLAEFYEEVMNQQNEIVDTSNYANPTRDQLLRLALDMYEAFEFSASDPEDFYQSPLGKYATPILFPNSKRGKAEDPKDANH